MNNLPYVPTEYSTNPGIKKLGDEPYFIIDGLYPDYRNEIMDARSEDINKYYIEKPSIKNMYNTQQVFATHKFLMKTVSFWMAHLLSKKYKEIEFELDNEFYVFHNDFTGESTWFDEELNTVQTIKSPLCMCGKKCSGCDEPNPPYKNMFDNICSQVQEDVCVMRFDELVSAHVCLPSWWSPAEKMGMGMREIHEDVPGMDKTSYEHIWNACLHKGPYLRYNWALTNTSVLNQHPTKNIGKDFDNDELFLRIERQVLHGFSNIGGVVFLIRTYVGDIKTLEPDQRMSIAGAIEGMNEEELEYKGMTDCRNKIISTLKS